MDIKVWENPNSAECIRCMDCVKACPCDAILSPLDQLKQSSFKRKEEKSKE